MIELLQINAMNDVSFTLGDVITIGGGAIVTITTFVKLQFDLKAMSEATIVRFETMQKEQTKEVDNLKENLIHITNGKRTMKKEIIELIEKNAEISNNRIDKANSRIEEDKRQNQIEFKEINKVLNQILGYVKKD
jgi:septal ring factor EnvC (AmiA/AmiB activator)